MQFVQVPKLSMLAQGGKDYKVLEVIKLIVVEQCTGTWLVGWLIGWLVVGALCPGNILGHITVTVRTHGDFIVLPHLQTSLPESYPIKSHYHDTKLTSPWPILLMLSSKLGSDENQFCKSLVWLDLGESNSQSPAWEACRRLGVLIQPPCLVGAY